MAASPDRLDRNRNLVLLLLALALLLWLGGGFVASPRLPPGSTARPPLPALSWLGIGLALVSIMALPMLQWQASRSASARTAFDDERVRQQRAQVGQIGFLVVLGLQVLFLIGGPARTISATAAAHLTFLAGMLSAIGTYLLRQRE